MVLKRISDEAYSTPNVVLQAPKNTVVTRLDEVKASHPKTMALSWKMYLEKSKRQRD
jgi:glycine dehydrogenase subunit 2